MLNQSCTRVKTFWQIILQINNPITPLSSNSVLKCTLNVDCTTMQNFVQWWKPFQLKINCFPLFDLIVVDKIKTTTIRLIILMVNYYRDYLLNKRLERLVIILRSQLMASSYPECKLLLTYLVFTTFHCCFAWHFWHHTVSNWSNLCIKFHIKVCTF